MTTPEVRVSPTADELARTVASALLERLAAVQAEGRTPHVALTGGTIADVIHREVARLAPDTGVDFADVVFWFGDERFVPADSDERNAGQARSAFLDEVGASQVIEVPSASDVATADEAAAAYEATLRARLVGELDVVMLGVGPDGHVASLFPGFPQLEETEALAVGVADSPKPPSERVTLTFETLNRAAAVWFLVSGDGKADAVARALDGADLHDIPATGVHGRTETVWWLDEAAASRL
ncbi:MAG TPA: 6-phosphogluconolactonase [Nocardioides sp.]